MKNLLYRNWFVGEENTKGRMEITKNFRCNSRIVGEEHATKAAVELRPTKAKK